MRKLWRWPKGKSRQLAGRTALTVFNGHRMPGIDTGEGCSKQLAKLATRWFEFKSASAGNHRLNRFAFLFSALELDCLIRWSWSVRVSTNEIGLSHHWFITYNSDLCFYGPHKQTGHGNNQVRHNGQSNQTHSDQNEHNLNCSRHSATGCWERRYSFEVVPRLSAVTATRPVVVDAVVQCFIGNTLPFRILRMISTIKI